MVFSTFAKDKAVARSSSESAHDFNPCILGTGNVNNDNAASECLHNST